MRQKQLILLLGILVVLGGLAYFTGAFDSASSTLDVPRLDIASDEIDQVTIRNGSASFTLARQADTWRVVAPVEGMADTTLVSQFLESAGTMQIESLVSTNPDRYQQFGVDSSGTLATLNSAGGSQSMYLGNTGPDFQSFYVRLEDNPNVYLAKGRMNAPTDLNRWRNKRILSIEPTDVQMAVVQTDAASYSAAYGVGTGWALNRDGNIEPADSIKIMAWLNRFRNLTATDFSDTSSLEDIQSSASQTLKFTLGNGTTTTLWLQEEADRLIATATNAESVFTLNSNQLMNYIPDPASLLP